MGICDDFDNLDTWKKVLIIFICVMLFVSFFLIGFSVTVLEPVKI